MQYEILSSFCKKFKAQFKKIQKWVKSSRSMWKIMVPCERFCQRQYTCAIRVVTPFSSRKKIMVKVKLFYRRSKV